MFCSGKHEEKADIYDFGVILQEVIMGRAAKSRNEVDALKILVINNRMVPL